MCNALISRRGPKALGFEKHDATSNKPSSPPEMKNYQKKRNPLPMKETRPQQATSEKTTKTQIAIIWCKRTKKLKTLIEHKTLEF